MANRWSYSSQNPVRRGSSENLGRKSIQALQSQEGDSPKFGLFKRKSQVGKEQHDRESMGVGHRASITAIGHRKSRDGKDHEDDEQKADDGMGIKGVFIDSDAMKERVRKNLMKPEHRVADYYKESGFWRTLATHPIFDQGTLAVISFNAIWIAVDTDHNPSVTILDAEPVFQAMEHFFCVFFTFEWLVRFMAFKRKRDGLRDVWFIFDSALVLLMVLETWIMTLIIVLANGSGGGGMGNMTVLRVARLLRLSRMARVARLLRAMPELMIMIKGMLSATRSVFFTLCLLVIIMYVFGIAFTQLAEGTPLEDKYFGDVAHSMYTLLLYGTFLDEVGVCAKDIGQVSYVYGAVFFFFILLAALTVMNMLIGVLCEVVSAVAATEKEEMLVNYVNGKLRKVVEFLDTDGDNQISKKEFMLILENMNAVRALQDVGVDVIGLVDFADYIFEDDDGDEEQELSFPKFMEVVLQLRGSNGATVKDIVDLRKFIRNMSIRTTAELQEIKEHLNIPVLPKKSMSNKSHSGRSPSKSSVRGKRNGTDLRHSHESPSSKKDEEQTTRSISLPPRQKEPFPCRENGDDPAVEAKAEVKEKAVPVQKPSEMQDGKRHAAPSDIESRTSSVASLISSVSMDFDDLVVAPERGNESPPPSHKLQSTVCQGHPLLVHSEDVAVWTANLAALLNSREQELLSWSSDVTSRLEKILRSRETELQGMLSELSARPAGGAAIMKQAEERKDIGGMILNPNDVDLTIGNSSSSSTSYSTNKVAANVKAQNWASQNPEKEMGQKFEYQYEANATQEHRFRLS